VHDEATRAEDTDWRQILILYELLERTAPGPMVTLSRIVALAMVRGARAGLAELVTVPLAPLANHCRVHAVRAHLLELAGEGESARAEYELAARRTLSLPEQRYLRSRASSLPAAEPRPDW
jgi:predicted RNA polymerase sigma factor